MNSLLSHNTLKIALVLGSTLLLPSAGFAQGNAPKDLNVTNIFGPGTEAAFYLDLEGIKKSGFIKKAEEKFPELMEGLEDAEEDLGEFTEVTGIAVDDLAEITISISGMDEIFAAIESGEEPDLGPNMNFVATLRLSKPVDVKEMIANIMAKTEEEDGPEIRKMIEDSRSEFRGATLFTVPKEIQEENDLPFPMAAGIRSVGKQAFLVIGKTADVKRFFAGGKGKKLEGVPFASEARKALPEGSQFWLSVPLPEAFLEQVKEELSENPLMAGLAQVMDKMRELGIGLHFKDESMSFNIALACEDVQSAVQVWTLSNGLLAMAKLAASSEEVEVPPLLQKLTSVAKEKSVLISTEVTLEDLSFAADNIGIGGGFEPGGIEIEDVEEGKNPEDLVGENAPDFEVSLLDGKDFKLSAARGKNVVVLDFWATWCGPCVKAMPEVRAATDALKDKGVILVAVNQGERPGEILGFLKKRKWDGLTVGLDPESEIADQFGVEGIPQTVIIDKEGVIRQVHVGYELGLKQRLLRELNEILSE